MEGSWSEAVALSKQLFAHSPEVQSSVLYAIGKQQFLEQLNRREYQNAFDFLKKRLKQLEAAAPHGELMKLSYMLTSSIQDVPEFADWEQTAGRRSLLMLIESLMAARPKPADVAQVPKARLVELLRQAVSYQVASACRHQQEPAPKVETLLHNFETPAVPGHCQHVFRDHGDNVKCVGFVGTSGIIASGCSDKLLRLWDTGTGKLLTALPGHTARIWDISSTSAGDLLATASGDETAKVETGRSYNKARLRNSNNNQPNQQPTKLIHKQTNQTT
eukprot:m.210399 g.210399  ORF g.210399 m.210399 type:complete len:275 (-) comp18560_c0_seq1:72-896(-)